ncbi:unnamed protein product [Staurois parvus]|uniref:Uncharacterized protein n=1 Tax=Staurois parvus TaxID=386267 RepID=A0ABN9FL30_9NEOB|nr:unnamed protein product [Staurois parvus]
MFSLVCIARESACDQHRANQHCPHRGSGGFTSSQSRKKTPHASFNQCSAEVTRLL